MKNIPKWVTLFLKFAGFYNLAWGVFIFNKPLVFYQSLNQEVFTFPWFVPWLGVLVGLLGWVYWWAAVNPARYWYLILIGLLTKTGGALGGDWLLLAGENPQFWGFVLHLVFNDMLWILPFGWAFYISYQLAKESEVSN
jgi:hypothetical protein